MGVSVPTGDLLEIANNMVKSFKLCFLVVRTFTTELAATPSKGDGYSMFLSGLNTQFELWANNLDSMCSSGSPLQAYKLVFNSAGQPNLQFVAQSALSLGCHGSPTVTSLNGQPGSAIVSSKTAVCRRVISNC